MLRYFLHSLRLPPPVPTRSISIIMTHKVILALAMLEDAEAFGAYIPDDDPEPDRAKDCPEYDEAEECRAAGCEWTKQVKKCSKQKARSCRKLFKKYDKKKAKGKMKAKDYRKLAKLCETKGAADVEARGAFSRNLSTVHPRPARVRVRSLAVTPCCAS